MKSQTLAGFVALAGCGKDNDGGPKAIKVDVTDIRTKADGLYKPMGGETVTNHLKNNGFVLDAYIDDVAYDYSDNPKTEYPAGKYVNSGGNVNVDYDDGRSDGEKWQISGTPNWVSDVKTQFWAYYPASLKGVLAFDEVESPYNAMTFRYTMPTANGTTDASANFDDPVFCHVEQRFSGSNETVKLLFHHALAQIRFFVTLSNSEDPKKCSEGVSITKIELYGVKNSGSCSFTGDNTFSWSNQRGDYVFGQDNIGTFTSDDWQDHNIVYDGKLFKYGFYVIPQANSGISLKVTITNGTKTITSQRELRTSSQPEYVWQADNYYTYKLTITDDELADITLVSANAQHQAFDESINLEY